mmetsp:Transcript_1924/g.4344  ORF Transcript_1924/g.4344 Transcript_1924/m.4344 type:complete len:211 (-) Transcript_1924:49-681(-)
MSQGLSSEMSFGCSTELSSVLRWLFVAEVSSNETSRSVMGSGSGSANSIDAATRARAKIETEASSTTASMTWFLWKDGISNVSCMLESPSTLAPFSNLTVSKRSGPFTFNVTEHIKAGRGAKLLMERTYFWPSDADIGITNLFVLPTRRSSCFHRNCGRPVVEQEPFVLVEAKDGNRGTSTIIFAHTMHPAIRQQPNSTSTHRNLAENKT